MILINCYQTCMCTMLNNMPSAKFLKQNPQNKNYASPSSVIFTLQPKRI